MKFRIYWPCCCVRQGQDRSWNFGSPDWPKFVVRAWQWREVEIYKKASVPNFRGQCWTWRCPGNLVAGPGHWHGVVLGRRPDGQDVTRMGLLLFLFLVDFSLVWGLFYCYEPLPEHKYAHSESETWALVPVYFLIFLDCYFMGFSEEYPKFVIVQNACFNII